MMGSAPNPEAKNLADIVVQNTEVLTNPDTSIDEKVAFLREELVMPSVLSAQKYPEYRTVIEKITQNGDISVEGIRNIVGEVVAQFNNNTDDVEAKEFTIKELVPELREAYKSTFQILVDGEVVGYGIIGSQKGKCALPLRVLPKDEQGNINLQQVEIELSDGTRIPLSKDHVEYAGNTTIQLTPNGLKDRPMNQRYIRLAENTTPNEVLYLVTERGVTPVQSSDNGTVVLNDATDTMQRINYHASLTGGPIVNARGELVAMLESGNTLQNFNGKTGAIALSNTATKSEFQRLNEDMLDTTLLA